MGLRYKVVRKGGENMKYIVQATQRMRFEEMVIEANSQEEAQTIYNKKWNEGDIYSLDYDHRYGIRGSVLNFVD